jgi:hypothetical protein
MTRVAEAISDRQAELNRLQGFVVDNAALSKGSLAKSPTKIMVVSPHNQSVFSSTHTCKFD